MKNIVFILGITLLLFSCKKDKFDDVLISNTDCEKNIPLHVSYLSLMPNGIQHISY